MKEQDALICPQGMFPRAAALAGLSWVRTSAGTSAVVFTAADQSDQVGLLRDRRVEPLERLGGYSSNIPSPRDDGALLYATAESRGMQLRLRGIDGRVQTLGRTPVHFAGCDYTPSGRALVTLDAVGGVGTVTASRVVVTTPRSTRTILLPSSIASSLLVLDEQFAVVGDITDQPGAGSTLVDLAAGTFSALRERRFPLAYDSSRERVLMRDDKGALYWVSPTTGSEVRLSTASMRSRIVGGDFARY